MNFYQQSAEEVLEKLKTNRDGLTEAVVRERRAEYGRNQLAEAKPKSVLRVFFEQFADLLVIILIAAAVISMLTGNLESAVVILIVITLNAVLGTVQHFKAEKSLKSLKELSSPVTKVIRDGVQHQVPSGDLVPGDIVLLEAGDLVPADGRMIQNYSLQVNESALTGEAEGINKTLDPIPQENTALGDRTNMVFSGSLVTYGRGLVVVTGTGMETEIGKIAALMNATAERKTPLQVSLDQFSKKLSLLILGICAIVFGLSLYQKMPVFDSLMFAVALAVAAIPEALSSIVTISLAIGTSKMAKENAIMKNLRAVEGLGCVSIICSDKTGTLTQNKMTVTDTFTFEPQHKEQLLLCSALCNDSYFGDGEVMGDPTETALAAYYEKNVQSFQMVRTQFARLSEIPFDSDRKRMSTLHRIDGQTILFTKGAVDGILPLMTARLGENGTVPLSDGDRDAIREVNRMMSEQGLRVLAFAQRILPETDTITLADEQGYTFLGLIAMIDPPREESAAAVADCYRAGIKPIMITGDHITTASAIARQIGILKEGGLAVTGAEIDALSDEELSEKLPQISVYARVSPEHKIRIVDLWQKKGEIVAMTGDGVNDAPALKKADIGIAMGITGTEVSKDAASMILTDDNFATIIKSVANGRNIYANIKNAIKFLLSGNTSGILCVLYASVCALPVPFTAVHLLFINLLTDSLPALAIGMERPTGNLLDEKPRSRKESILTKDFFLDIILQGILIAIFTLLAFHIGLQTGPAVASTMAFSTLCMARLWHGFNSRGKVSVFKQGVFKNPYSIGAFLLGLGLLCAVLFIPPLRPLFEVARLSGMQILVVFVAAFLPTFFIQLYRVIKGFFKKK